MSDKELVPVDFTQLPATSMGSDDNFSDLATGGDFLARLQLFSKGNAVNEGHISPGNWGIPEGDDRVTCIGKTVDVIPFARRPKAIDMNDREAIETNYDMDSPAFKRIQNKSGEKDSGCMFGPSFLVWERTTARFLEWFCGTKSTRAEANKMYQFLTLSAEDIEKRGLEGQEPHGPLPFTMNIKLVKKPKWSWHAPVVIKCSTPFSRAPSIKQVLFEMDRFLNPSDSGVEKVDSEESGRGRAR